MAFSGGRDGPVNEAVFKADVREDKANDVLASNPTVVLDIMAGSLVSFAKHQVKSLDVISLNGLSLYNYLATASRPHADLVARTWCGPLSFLFDMMVIAKTPHFVGWVKGGPREYDNGAVLQAMSDAAPTAKSIYDARNAAFAAFNRVPPPLATILPTIKGWHTANAGKLQINDAVTKDLFGDVAGLAAWWHAKTMFCEYFTASFISAVVNHRCGTLKRIIDTFTRFCKTALAAGKWDDARIITPEVIAQSHRVRGDDPELICRLLQYLRSGMCCSAGAYATLGAGAESVMPNAMVQVNVAPFIMSYYQGKE